MLNSAIGRLRVIGFVEGVSFLVLLLIAMPLKYMWDRPEMVQVVGMLHGILFVLYMLAVLHAAYVKKWPFLRVVIAFIASLIPIGTFILDKQWRKEM